MIVPRRLHPPMGFMTQPTNHKPLSFEAQNKKPVRWFCGLNHQTVAAGFEAQTGKPADLGFEAEQKNSRSSSLYAPYRPHKVSPNLSIVRSPSTRPVLDHPQSSAPSLLLLPWSSSLPAMLHLSPIHHETSKHASPHDIYNRLEPKKIPEFKFKPRQINYSSQLKSSY
jgi:hypothetical protein